MMALYTGSFIALRGSAWMTITDIGLIVVKIRSRAVHALIYTITVFRDINKCV